MAKGITKAAIVQAALDRLDEAGIDGVTVRAVAERLGVRAPALYWHIRDKQTLLDEMGTEIERRVVAALRGRGELGWREGLTTFANVLRAEYLAHRDGARAFSGTRITDPEVLKAQEPWMRRWTETSDVPIEMVALAGELVTAFVVGFVIEEQERAQSGPDRYSIEARDAALGPDAPITAAAGHARSGDASARFTLQLEIVLDGLAARLGG
ncbi:TetR/AcrR family transcriptional regulator C-terminal domain-containing protein [Schumannella sp. 10F1B-5-1]|uniref:TetR/AcrR family transcriptional regulator C-terminal domain-containing protein n=1 Tax=Schumannella sp. 10F1B-5-1 TaxID=2590780 RepID=UPI0011322B35|nr:TetR/AcrR family transcriptional regulator C-terminal domain-containing protein [Schumannella sp. 10F1B-5-1]TPW76964.1 TetR family transcriptional regulator [Schumannella sp. 10F1B-5-1]